MTGPDLFLGGKVALHRGDCLDVLRAMEANSIDSCVMDPPYHLTSVVKRFGADGAAPAKVGKTGAFVRASRGFMGKQWDGGDIAFTIELWTEILRVLKPGAYVLAFASTRGFGRMSVAAEDAGFITHPMFVWCFATGFPKATRVQAEGYEGWRYGGQALKPALEPIYMGQKPFSEATGTANVLRWGTGALNIDRCRVATERETSRPQGKDIKGGNFGGGAADVRSGLITGGCSLGRWPANLLHDGSPEVLAMFPESAGQQRAVGPQHGAKPSINTFGDYGARELCEPRGDTGSAARFFFSAKADADDRLGSKHPTVKPVDLMQWLCRLVTPPGGTVLDCFAGTGTTGEAAWREGFRAVLVERELEYQADIARRMALCLAGPEERARAAAKARHGDVHAGPLFAEAAE